VHFVILEKPNFICNPTSLQPEKDLKIYVCKSVCNQLEMKGNLKFAWKSVKREGKHSPVRNEERNTLV